jgi:hypothetical protein
VIIALDPLFHVFDFTGRQARRDDSWAARVIIQIAPGLRAAPTVVARCGETRDSKRRVERQDLPGAPDCSQENPLGIAFWKSLVIELDLRCPKQGDQEAN